MACLSNTDASVCTPRMLPWRDWGEWHRVKDLLFSPEPFLRCQGVQHVAVWRSRERIPHAVETTAQLVEVRLNDVGPGGWDVACARRSEEELRLTYSTIVVRAVNGLTGHEQKTAHAAPVSSLAREIGLPTWLVDIRHEAAHKQLPGLVILRLAADFLIDYLWRRYWAPQDEHLRFLWGAFDQLICRFKSMSEIDPSLPCNCPGGDEQRQAEHPNSSPRTSSPAPGRVAPFSSPISSKKRRRKDDAPTTPLNIQPSASTASPAAPTDAAVLSSTEPQSSSPLDNHGSSVPQRNDCAQRVDPAPGGTSSGCAPNTARGAISVSSSPKSVGEDSTAEAAAAAAAAAAADLQKITGAAETAAREMACSVTPTALSWGVVSLLVDGGVSLGSSGAAGAHGVGEQGRRGQGHLLPRSRDKYPTPGSPGVDDEVYRKLTSRWAALLGIFHGRWRGFGAALLVRLVEVLIANASRQTTPTATYAACATADPAGGGSHSTGATRRGGQDSEIGSSGNRGNSSGNTAGLERQASFITLWVRHLLSRRWHLRSADATIRTMLRDRAAAAGLPPDFCDRPESSWEHDVVVWAESAAHAEVLEVAAFPLEELLARCRTTVANLAMAPSTSSGNDVHGANDTCDIMDATPSGAHWATAGLQAVIRCLESALAVDATVGSPRKDDADESRSQSREIERFNAGGGRPAAYDARGGDALRCRKMATGAEPTAAPSPACRENHIADEGSERSGEGNKHGIADARADSGPGAETKEVKLMDLEALERLLGGAGPAPASGLDNTAAPQATPPANTEPVMRSDGKRVSDWHGDMALTHGREKTLTAGMSHEVFAGSGQSGNDGAWEVVESWTPCAIGTLPGWSGAKLHP